jgi:translation initiation factor 3 subunit C
MCRRIQEEGLRTYLHTFSAQYTTLSLTFLSRTFELPLQGVRSLVSRMIWNDELPASLDQSSEVIVFHRVQPSHEQQLALSLADRISQLVEHNEKTLDLKLGGGNWQERSTIAQTTRDSARDERSRTSVKGECNNNRHSTDIHNSQESQRE